MQVSAENATLREKANSYDLLSADVLAWVMHARNTWDKEKKGYLRKIDSLEKELEKCRQ